jgi:hypothetical protein
MKTLLLLFCLFYGGVSPSGAQQAGDLGAGIGLRYYFNLD